MKHTKYYLAAIIAYSIWGLFSLVLKPIHAYSSIDILFYRVFSCALLMLLITLLFKRKAFKENIRGFNALAKEDKRTTILLNVGGSLLLTANWFSFIYVMNNISIKATSLAYLVCPILTTVLAYLLLKEKILKLQWVSVGLSIMGCILLSYANISDMLFSMVVGLSYACYLVSQRKNTGFDKFLVLTVHIVLSALILLPFYPSFSGKVPTAFLFYAHIEIIAVVFTIIPLFLNLFALNKLNSSTVGMLLNINPIIAFTLAYLVYREDITVLQFTAYAIIFISVIIFNANHFFTKRNSDSIAAKTV